MKSELHAYKWEQSCDMLTTKPVTISDLRFNIGQSRKYRIPLLYAESWQLIFVSIDRNTEWLPMLRKWGLDI